MVTQCFVIHQTLFISFKNETICYADMWWSRPPQFGCNLLKIALLIAKINRNEMKKNRVRKMDIMSADAHPFKRKTLKMSKINGRQKRLKTMVRYLVAFYQ